MSSAVLYLAIVAVWAVVLVPMWLRRDGDSNISRLLHKREDLERGDLEEEAVEDPETPDTLDAPETLETSETRPRRRPGRAAVIARRRRRTSGLCLLLATTLGLVAGGVAPWWITLPPFLLLGGHLSLLRVAVGVDIARRHDRAAQEHAARAAAALRARPAPQEPKAEIIELVTPIEEEVFDQYADDRRAVGE